MMQMFQKAIAYIQCLTMGPYIVSEDLTFGQFAKRVIRARFYSLSHAKAFAKRLMPQFGERVVVLDGMNLHPLYVYRQRRSTH